MEKNYDASSTVSNIQYIFNFEGAHKRIEQVLRPTNLIHSTFFSSYCSNNVYIKPENLQTTGAFKIRGAYNKISKLNSEQKSQGLISSSAGNHAQGVAYASKELGVTATIVMPKTTPLIKVESTKKYGANIVLHGDCYDEAYEEAKRLESSENMLFIHPFDDADVIEGQGTIAIEILNEAPNLDVIIVPVGGGGLIAGVATCAKALNPNIKIIGVEPEGANAMSLSMKNNKLTCLEKVCTIADGVAVKNPGSLTYELIKTHVDEIVEVSDFEIMEAFLLLMQNHKLVGENSGVLPFAALRKIKEKNKNIACIISGGNIDFLTISSLINQGLVSMGRIFCFSVNLPDKPGELAKISNLLAKLGANVIKLDHNQFKASNRFMDAMLEVTVETNGHNHVELIYDEMKALGYTIKRVY